MKICANCKWYNRYSRYHVCEHPVHADIISGVRFKYCDNARSENGKCGREGRLFEDRFLKRWLKRIFKTKL